MLYPAELRGPITASISAARRRLQLPCWTVLALLASAAAAAALEGGARPSGHLELSLEDGTRLRLAGVEAPRGDGDDPALTAIHAELGRRLATLLASGPVRTQAPTPAIDRHGRHVAHLETASGDWLQEALLRDGLALIRPDLGPGAAIERLRPAEAAARARGAGFWRAEAQVRRPAEAAAEAVGGFGLVHGRVVDVTRARRYLYLNFGADWRTDFTVRTDLKVARAIEKGDFSFDALEGRRIEVRGWVFEENGPMIEIGRAAAIEVIE